MAVGEAHGHIDPFPALGGDVVGTDLQLLGDEPVEQHGVLQPAAVVVLEQVAQDAAACGVIGVDTDEDRTLVRGADGGLGQHAADLIGFLRPAMADRFPHLLLARVVFRDREGHELLERHAVFGVDVEKRRRDGNEPQPLLHHLDRNEEGRGDRLVGHALVAHSLEGTELIERMQRRALDILGQRHLVDQQIGFGVRDDAGDRRRLGEALLLHEQFERAVAATARRHLEHAGLHAFGVHDGADMEALDEAAADDGLRQFVDGHAGFHAPDVGLAQHQLVEGDVARGRQGDLLNGSSHRDILRDGRPKASLSASNPSRKSPHSSYSLPGGAVEARRRARQRLMPETSSVPGIGRRDRRPVAERRSPCCSVGPVGAPAPVFALGQAPMFRADL